MATHTHTLAAADGPTSPGGLSQIGCQMLETAALITAFTNTLPFMFIRTLIYLPQEIKQDRHSLIGPRGKLGLWESVCVRQISAAKITANLPASQPARVVIQTSSLTEYICRCSCVYSRSLFVSASFFLFFLDGLRNIKVCYLPPWNSATSKTSTLSPTRTREPSSFLPVHASPVFHRSVAQKAKASNDTRYKMERLLPTK